jgi:anti-anti-sigma factor
MVRSDSSLAVSVVVIGLDDASLLDGLSDLRWRLGQLLHEGAETLIVDLSRLERFSSATLATLLWTQRSCRARGVHLVVRGPGRRCREVLTRTGLETFFDLRPAPEARAG